MDVFTLIILGGIGSIIIATITIWSQKHYEVAIFLVALSTWLSAIFVPNVPMEVQEAGMSSFLRIGLLTWVGVIGFFQFFKLRSNLSEKLPSHFILLTIFVLFALISTGYSIDPKYTLIRSCSFIALYGFLLGLHYWLQDSQRFEGALNTIFLLICFIVTIDAMSMAFFPDRAWWWEVDSRFQGLWAHPNTMGSVCMISYPVLLWKYSRSTVIKKAIIIILIIALGTMQFLAGSRSSLMATFLGIFIWFFIQKKKVKIIFLLGMVGILTLSIIQLRPSSFQREEGAEFTDLTGREEFWHGSYVLLMERPLYGFGYGVEGKIWEDPRFHESKLTLWSGSAKTSLHNGYLSIAIGSGIIIFVVWCMILLSPLWQSISLPSNDYKAFAYTIMVMGLLLNFFETVITDTSSLAAILFWIAWVLAGKLPNSFMKDVGLV